MKALIDTQVFVWLINADKKLGQKTLSLLSDTSNQVCISYFSFFEMTIKASLGKLDYNNSVIDDLPKMGIELIMPNVDALQHYDIYNPANKDPFDNILLTVAKNEKCTFITSDAKILSVTEVNLKLIDAQK